MSDPWMKFYPADWRSDPKLRLCSMAARGLWMEMLCLMHEATPYGELRVGDVALDENQLSRLVSEPAEAVSGWLSELLAAGVYSVRKNGVIYSRRMEKDEIKRRKLRENGKKGGNPNLCKVTENRPLVNQEDKTTEARSQIPEARKKEKARKRAISYPDDFEVFWSAYPDKTNNSKKRAGEEWAKLDEADRAAATGALVPYKRFLAKPNPPACIHAERFLSQRRFDGYAEQARGAKPPAPIEITDSREHQFLVACRDDGATGWQRWAKSGFEIHDHGGETVCVVDGPVDQFDAAFKPTAKRLGYLIWNRAFYEKQKAKAA